MKVPLQMPFLESPSDAEPRLPFHANDGFPPRTDQGWRKHTRKTLHTRNCACRLASSSQCGFIASNGKTPPLRQRSLVSFGSTLRLTNREKRHIRGNFRSSKQFNVLLTAYRCQLLPCLFAPVLRSGCVLVDDEPVARIQYVPHGSNVLGGGVLTIAYRRGYAGIRVEKHSFALVQAGEPADHQLAILCTLGGLNGSAITMISRSSCCPSLSTAVTFLKKSQTVE